MVNIVEHHQLREIMHEDTHKVMKNRHGKIEREKKDAKMDR